MVQIPKTIRLPHAEYANSERVFHVTFRAAVGERPFASRATADAIWELLLNERSRGSIELLAACLMPDHVHVVASPRGKNLIKWVDGFKSWSTRVAQRTRPQRILWQPGFFDRAIRDEAELEAALRYVLDNPVTGGLVEEREQWPWAAFWVNE